MTRKDFSIVVQIQDGKGFVALTGRVDGLLMVGATAAQLLKDEDVTALMQSLQDYITTPKDGAVVPFLTATRLAPKIEGSTYTAEQLQALYVRALKEIPEADPPGSKHAIARWQVHVTDEDTSLIVPYTVLEPGGIWTEKTHRVLLS